MSNEGDTIVKHTRVSRRHEVPLSSQTLFKVTSARNCRAVGTQLIRRTGNETGGIFYGCDNDRRNGVVISTVFLLHDLRSVLIL